MVQKKIAFCWEIVLFIIVMFLLASSTASTDLTNAKLHNKVRRLSFDDPHDGNYVHKGG
ncbi:hypothetical protein IC582_017191 [Cucumis melo]